MRLNFVTPIIAAVLVSALPIGGAIATKAVGVEVSADMVQFHSPKQSAGMREGAMQRLPISGPGRPL